MQTMPSRNQLQEKAEHKLRIIKGHFREKEYDDVAENSGYVIEFGLKAAICKHECTETYPDDKKYFVHNLEKLMRMANLSDSFELKKSTSADFFANWSLISKWSPEFRYQPIGMHDKNYAIQIINAIDNKSEGVFPWVKMNW